MELVRIIRAGWWDDNQGRFTDLAFKRSSTAGPSSPDGYGGISVFDANCALGDDLGAPRSICGHIARFYGHFATEPLVYWRFELEDLAQGANPHLAHVPSDSGDECHRDIHGLSRNEATKAFYRLASPPEDHLRICDGGDQPFTVERIREIKSVL